jgi:hypothetical protein
MRARFVLLTFGWLAAIVSPSLAISAADPGRRLEAGVVVGVAVLAGLALLCRRVGYRSFDALFALIPVYGLCFQVKMIWRAAGLPNRYWERLGSTRAHTNGRLDTGWHPVPWEPRFFRYWDGRKWRKEIVPADQLEFGPPGSAS